MLSHAKWLKMRSAMVTVRVNLRSIDNSKDLLFGQLLRVQSLLKSRMGAVDTDTKAHFKAMLYLIDEALDARSK